MTFDGPRFTTSSGVLAHMDDCVNVGRTMKPSHVRLGMSLLLLIAAACAAPSSSSDEASAASTAAARRPPEVLELACADASGLKIDVAKYGASNFNVIITPADAAVDGIVKLFCFPPSGASAPSVGVCGDARQGWFVSIDEKTEVFVVSATPGHGAPATTLACAPPARPDTPIPTYAEVAPLIKQNCDVCHNQEFATLDGVRRTRELMLEMIAGGAMPTFNLQWKDTPRGQKVLDFLRHSPEL